MVVLMALATLWGVLALGLLGSATRTLRLATLALAVGAGCYGCGVLAVFAELVSTHVMHTEERR